MTEDSSPPALAWLPPFSARSSQGGLVEPGYFTVLALASALGIGLDELAT
jgi:hypothetical protein